MSEPLTPEEEAKARREKVEKMAGQAFDAASGAAKQASELANKAFAFGQEKLGKVDVDALKQKKFPVKPVAIGVGGLVALFAVISLLGGGSTPYEKVIKDYYSAVEKGDMPKVLETIRGVPNGMEGFVEVGIKVAKEAYAARGGIDSVEPTCGKPQELQNDILLVTCEVKLKMGDGTEVNDGFRRVSRIDGEWKFVI